MNNAGDGLERNYVVGRAIFESLSVKYHAPSLYFLGLFDFSGKGGHMDKKRGLELCQTIGKRAKEFFETKLRIEEQKKSDDIKYYQYGLGLLFDFGHHGKKDPQRAVELYKLSADNGHSGAMNCLANCYDNGNGCVKNIEKALEFYEKSANLGEVFLFDFFFLSKFYLFFTLSNS